MQEMFRKEQIERYYELKEQYLTAHHGAKRALLAEIEKLKEEIAKRAHPNGEVRGFDIVLTNPPYLRQEVVKRQFGDEYKELLATLYPEAFVKTADIYVAFYARAHQLLKPSGVGCFISSNKWLRAGYGEKLRQALLDKQAFLLVLDFGDLPVFQATAYPAIFLWQKEPREDVPTMWAVVKDLQACYAEGIREHIERIAEVLSSSQFGKGKPRLASPKAAERRAKIEASGPRLGELVGGQIYRGVLTGLNEAFIIDRETRDHLIAEDPKSAEIIRPLLKGDDVRRYEVHFRETYLIWTYIGVPIEEYPAVFEHLKQFQAKAEKRWDKGEHWWELRACDYYAAFERPKIVYPEIAKETRFSFDFDARYTADTVHIMAVGDWYLLGTLNSTPVWWYLTNIVAEIRGGYVRFKPQYLETLPIPDAPKGERESVSRLAQQAQQLHIKRRTIVERFLCDISTPPAQSSSRNPLEQPWTLTPDEFTHRARKYGTPDLKLFHRVREETAALTEEIEKVEHEIDKRVEALYG
jgi:hypothetical protein